MRNRSPIRLVPAIFVFTLLGCGGAQPDLANYEPHPAMSSGDAGTTEISQDAASDSAVNPSETKPTVLLTATPMTVTAAGDINFSVGANAPSGISKVVLFRGATAFATLTSRPYFAQTTVSRADNGTVAFTAQATSNAGSVVTSAPVMVTIDIPAAPPPPPPPPSVPEFVAAGSSTVIAGSTSLSLPTPSGLLRDDFMLALVDAEEGAGPRVLSAPAGWTLIGGFPIHNLASDYPPYVIPATENHGTWIFQKFVGPSEPAATVFVFPSAATARGVVVSYRGVDKIAPIHDKSAIGFFGPGDTNGLGSGNTTLTAGRVVNLIATALTSRATYTVVQTSMSVTERVNSGEQPNGLNVIVHDSKVVFRTYSGPWIANMQSPSGLSDDFLFSATTLVLKPL